MNLTVVGGLEVHVVREESYVDKRRAAAEILIIANVFVALSAATPDHGNGDFFLSHIPGLRVAAKTTTRSPDGILLPSSGALFISFLEHENHEELLYQLDSLKKHVAALRVDSSTLHY